MDLPTIVNWNRMSRDRVQKQAFVRTVTKFMFPQKGRD